MRSNGLVTLLHLRILVGGRVAAVFCEDHTLLVAAPLAVCLSIANLHLPPSLHPDTRRPICAVVALPLAPQK